LDDQVSKLQRTVWELRLAFCIILPIVTLTALTVLAVLLDLR